MLLFRRICQFKNYGGADDSIDVKNARWMDLVTECFDLEMLRLPDAATTTHESYISNSKDSNSSMSNSNSMSMSSNSSISNSNNMSKSNSNSSLEIVILEDMWTLADDKKKRVLVNSYRAYLDLGC